MIYFDRANALMFVWILLGGSSSFLTSDCLYKNENEGMDPRLLIDLRERDSVQRTSR